MVLLFLWFTSSTPRWRHQRLKASISRDTSLLFFFLLDLVVNGNCSAFFCLSSFFARARISPFSTRLIYDCTVAEGLDPRRLDTPADLDSLDSAFDEAKAGGADGAGGG